MEKSKNIRIAFCFSGQLRTWRKCLDSWKKLAEAIENQFQTKIDFFAHTWNFNTHPNIILTKDWTNVEYAPVSDQEIKDYRESLNFLDFYVDDIERSKTRYFNLQHISRSMNFIDKEATPVDLSWAGSQFYSVMKCAHLKKKYELQNNVIYDIVFRLRNDLFFTDDNIDQFVARNNFSTWRTDLYIPEHNSIYSCHTGRDNEWPFIRLGDIFFYGNSLTFDRICDFYRWLPHLEFHKMGKHLSTERALFYYAKMMKLKIKPIFIDPKICRGEDYLLLKKEKGLGDLGGFEIV